MGPLSFSYPITRPYPYRWFKWIVLVGGICVTVLFSILNFAANGYVLKVQYTTDFNKTIAKKPWAQKISLPLDGKMAPSCQSQNLQVNSQYYTDKLSLVYHLANIWKIDDKGKVITLPALQCANNPLENCTVSLIQMDLSSNDRTAAQIGWTAWGANALGMATCLVNNNNGPTWLNLTVHYEFVTPTIESGAAFQFVQPPDEQTQTSLWWGESLLSWYWLNLVQSMKQQATYDVNSGSQTILKGSIALRPSLNVTDITNLDFLALPKFHFILNNMNKDGDIVGNPACCINPGDNPKSIGGLHESEFSPDIWIEADSFAKVFYSMILADLGETSSVNLLSNSTSLTAFAKNITNMIDDVENPWLKAGPARSPYSEESSKSLNITPSVFYTEYLCQVPTPKSTGSLIVAILVADLVFLNVAWVILNWVTTTKLQMSESTTHHCAGCVNARGDSIALVETPAGPGTKSQYEPIRDEQQDFRRRITSAASTRS